MDTVIDLLEVGPEGYVLSEANEAAIAAELDRLSTEPELGEAVDALLRLAHVLEIESSSPSAAEQICRLLEREPVVDGLRRLTEDTRRGAVEAAAQKFQNFAGEPGAQKAPQSGEKPAKGTVKLDAFRAPRRV